MKCASQSPLDTGFSPLSPGGLFPLQGPLQGLLAGLGHEEGSVGTQHGPGSEQGG